MATTTAIMAMMTWNKIPSIPALNAGFEMQIFFYQD